MKKLEKMSLIQLAEVMPVICENEQKCCVGGSDFFVKTPSGVQYLGHVSDGHDEVRFTDYETYYQLGGSGSNPGSLYNSSQSLAELNNNTGNQVSAASLAYAYCDSKATGVTTIISDILKDKDGNPVTGLYDPETDTIKLSLDELSVKITNGNFSEFRSAVTHEYAHHQTYSTIKNNTAYSSVDKLTSRVIELAALAAQINEGVPTSYTTSASYKDACNNAASWTKDHVDILTDTDRSNYETVKQFYEQTYNCTLN
ncbi:MAG: hypothetical protein PHI48_06925 [Bacteroidales bacterium]|nr:hypothetical protein [Bacteroidales bacterium]